MVSFAEKIKSLDYFAKKHCSYYGQINCSRKPSILFMINMEEKVFLSKLRRLLRKMKKVNVLV